jgi:hypothetical protein
MAIVRLEGLGKLKKLITSSKPYSHSAALICHANTFIRVPHNMYILYIK